MHDMYGAHEDGEYNPFDGDAEDPSGTCVNCGEEFYSPVAALYCSDLCNQEARLVRYVRRCRHDGRLEDPDIWDVIEIRRAHVLGGGYDERGRRLSPSARADVIARDAGRCRMCGEEGTEIDHIASGSDDPRNLRLLCHRCHVAKTIASFRQVAPGDEDYEEVDAHARALIERIDAPKPLRDCDDPERWDSLWPRLLQERRTLWSAG